MRRPWFVWLSWMLAGVIGAVVAVLTPAEARAQSAMPAPRLDLFDFHDANDRGKTNLQHLLQIEAGLGDRHTRLDELRARNATGDDALTSEELAELLTLEDEIGAVYEEWSWRRELNDLLQWLIDTFAEPANSIEDELVAMATWMRDYVGAFIDRDKDRDAMASVQRLRWPPRGKRAFEPGLAHKHAIRFNRELFAAYMREDDGPRSRNRWFQDLLLLREGEVNGALLRALVDEWASLNFNETKSDLDHRLGETVWNYFVDRDTLLRARAVVNGTTATDDSGEADTADSGDTTPTPVDPADIDSPRKPDAPEATDAERLALLQAEWSVQHDINRFVALRNALVARFIVDDYDGHVRDGEWLYDAQPTEPYPTELPELDDPNHEAHPD